jgi:hypothetical protein
MTRLTLVQILCRASRIFVEKAYANLGNRPWVPKARELMRQKHTFGVTNWDEEVDGKEAKELIEEFNYMPPVLYAERKVYFFPID